MNWRHGLLAGISLAVITAAFWIPAIPQDPAYHAFADGRSGLGLPNFWNVASNLPFLLVGFLGLGQLRLQAQERRAGYQVFCIGVMLVSLGSGWYHWAPDTPRLAWDRLPMTLAFMALFSLVLQDRVSAQLGRAMLWPLVLAGAASVFYWDWSEEQGQGDLRPYALVQFLPLLLIPLMLLLWRGRCIRDTWMWATIGAYALAKLAEYLDSQLLQATGFLSGHSLKHLLAALGAWCAVVALQPAASLEEPVRQDR